MLDKSIKELIKKNKKSYKQVLSMIKKYDKIVIFRHEMPDYDALGTQMGLATWLKENFKEKEIHVTGQNHVCFTPRLYPYMEEMEDAWFDNNEFLAIVVDTGNTARISDKRYQKAKNIIKIDHHPNKEPYGDIVIVNDELASCAELVANMLVYFNKKLSKEAAHYFYSGIAGDSGRFLYNSTSAHTFAIAQILIETGFNLSKDVYQKMYQKNIDDLKVTAYVLMILKYLKVELLIMSYQVTFKKNLKSQLNAVKKTLICLQILKELMLGAQLLKIQKRVCGVFLFDQKKPQLTE